MLRNDLINSSHFERSASKGMQVLDEQSNVYGPGTVDIFRQNMEMGKLSFDDLDIPKINRQLELETRFASVIEKVLKESKLPYQILLINCQQLTDFLTKIETNVRVFHFSTCVILSTVY